jgi:hypothetical protein
MSYQGAVRKPFPPAIDQDVACAIHVYPESTYICINSMGNRNTDDLTCSKFSTSKK